MKTSTTVKDYYERNTRLFLWLGGGRAGGVIHRALWLPGVTNRPAALQAVHGLIAAAAPHPAAGLRVLDLGCGAGGSLCALAQMPALGLEHGLGVTLSRTQVQLAARRAQDLGLADRLRFLQADFTCLPQLEPPVDLAYAVESFVHGTQPPAFFEGVQRCLAPGGRLVLVDDFLTPLGAADPRHPVVMEFQRGWHAPGLMSAAAAAKLAAAYGLILVEDRSLSAFLRLNTWRDRWTAVSAGFIRRLGLRGAYFDSLLGGDALRSAHCAGLIDYRMITFERPV